MVPESPLVSFRIRHNYAEACCKAAHHPTSRGDTSVHPIIMMIVLMMVLMMTMMIADDDDDDHDDDDDDGLTKLVSKSKTQAWSKEQ